MRRFLPLVVLMLLVFPAPIRVRAQTGQTVVQFASGYSMVGSPAGNDFAPGDALYIYRDSAYVTRTGRRPNLCEGYWAYFKRPALMSIALAPVAATIRCELRAGWNMIANPFVAVASLPTDVSGYYWDTETQRYDVVHAIPMGGAVWIYADSTGSVTLQPHLASNTVTVVAGGSRTPYVVHVGDLVRLRVIEPGPSLPGGNFLTSVNPQFLLLETSTIESGEPTFQTWEWLATNPGSTRITLTPACVSVECAAPSQEILLDILP